MKLLYFIFLANLFFCSLSSAQNPGSGKGSSGGGSFPAHTLRLAKGSESNNKFCEKTIREVVPLGLFKDWFEIQFSFAQKSDQGKLMQLALKLNSAMLAEDSKLKFASQKEIKEWGIDNKLNIDIEIIYRFSRDVSHPLMGSQHIVLSVDSVKQIAYFKFNEDDCLFKLE
jgi:hypothetical protein